MTDELVKRLRSMHWCVTTETNGVGVSDRKVALDAADRIEALTAQLAEDADARALVDARLEQLFNTLLIDGARLQTRAEDAEAENERLREALESLHGFADGWRECGCGDSCYGRHAERNMVLDHLHDFARAALKGETP